MAKRMINNITLLGLTYPFPEALVKMIFIFARCDMLALSSLESKMVRTYWKVPKSWNTWFPPNKKQHQTQLLRSRSFKIGSNSPNSTPLKLNQWESESPGSVTHKSTRRRPCPIYDLIWFITWNGNKSTCYHDTRMNLTVDVFLGHFIFFLTYMRENLRTTPHPKRQLCWESQEYFGKWVSQSRKRGVSFPGSSKVCPLFANFFWSTKIYRLPIFISSYLHIVPHRDKNPGIF